MAVIKCKMCGGDLAVIEDATVAECEYCGTKQTVPKVDDEKKLTLFSRANRLRLACEFDKAAGVYESIVADFPEEAEAYWGLVLCRYGIEYVDDPATGKKVPTCHRSSFDSILEDGDFDQACENADAIARRLYRDEAKAIEDIRKGILEVSGKEEPYDIFICYKETDETGGRTIDSVLAQDVYDALTEKDYRVFFSRISLEDKLGTEYEPYIFAALNSAKIMLAFGTDFEYFNAVWVKNEWSRFLKLMAQDKSKHLIPCYKNVDAYDMPKEFAKLQAQDMGKVGAIQDLLRGIDKLLDKGQKETVKETVVVQSAVSAGGPTVDSLLKRGRLFLEESDWEQADTYFDKVLDVDPENGEAYAGKFCVAQKYHSVAEIAEHPTAPDVFQQDKAYQKVLRFASPELKAQLEGYIAAANQKLEVAKSRLAARREALRPVAFCVAAAMDYTVGLKADGTVVGVGSIYDRRGVSGWRDIVAIAAGSCHIVGLKSDGTVVAAGENKDGQCDVSGWRDIVAVTTARSHTVGLRADGTVVATRYTGDMEYYRGQCDVQGWTDIVAIAVGATRTVGLKADGTVVAVGENKEGQCDVSGWRDIVAVAAGVRHTVGLKADGTVVATRYTGDMEYCCGQCDVQGWTDIVAVAAGAWHTVGLRADGTVVSTKYTSNMIEYDGECDVQGWTDIMAIAAEADHTVGLKADGTVVATKYIGHFDLGQCEVDSWKLFNSIDTLEQERAEARAKAELEAKAKAEAEAERQRQEEQARQAKIAALEAEKQSIQAELPNIKGLFSGGKRRELEARLAKIEEELEQI